VIGNQIIVSSKLKNSIDGIVHMTDELQQQEFIKQATSSIKVHI